MYLSLFLATLCLRCCAWVCSRGGGWGLVSSCCVWASHRSGFSRGRAQALGAWALVIAARGLISCGLLALGHASFSSCGTRSPQLCLDGPRVCRLQYLWCAGSVAVARGPWSRGAVAPQHVGSSRARGPTGVPCPVRWVLIHCSTREAPRVLSSKNHVKGLTLLGNKFYKNCNISKGIDRKSTSDSSTSKHLFYNKCTLQSSAI